MHSCQNRPGPAGGQGRLGQSPGMQEIFLLLEEVGLHAQPHKAKRNELEIPLIS